MCDADWVIHSFECDWRFGPYEGIQPHERWVRADVYNVWRSEIERDVVLDALLL